MAERLCKYGCGTKIEWDDKISGYRNVANAEPHTPQLCKEIKKSKGNTTTSKNNDFLSERIDVINANIQRLIQRVDELDKNFIENKELKEALAKASFQKGTEVEKTS